MKVRDLMTEAPACCTRATRLRDVAALMVKHDCGGIPVVDSEHDRRPVGMITDRDIVVRAVACGLSLDDVTAGEHMSSPCIHVHPDDPMVQCCAVMEEHQLRRVLVVEDERLCGIWRSRTWPGTPAPSGRATW